MSARSVRDHPVMVSSVAAPDVERVFREEYARAVAVLVRVFGDIDLAEEAVQDAFAEAAYRWPKTGPPQWKLSVPRNPPWCCWTLACRRIPAARKKDFPRSPNCSRSTGS